MSRFEDFGPRASVPERVRVDKVSPRARAFGSVRALIILLFAMAALIPVGVMGLTAFKTRADVVASPPKVFFQPTLEGFVFLFTERAVVTQARLPEFEQRAQAGQMSLFERIAFTGGTEITGPSDYVVRLRNSLIIAGFST